MKISAIPYFVICENGRGPVKIPVVNANGVYKSIELEKLQKNNADSVIALNKAREKYSLLQVIFESKTIAELNEDERQVLIDLEDALSFSRKTNAEFISAMVKEKGFESVIDEILPEEMAQFNYCLQLAAIGRSSEETEEKKILQKSSEANKIKSGSKGGGIRKKK